MTTYIELPYKTTSKVDWETSLKKFLDITFGKSFSADISSSIEKLDKLRVDIEHGTVSDGATLIPIYMDYLTQLDSLELRIPMHAVIGGNDVQFEWLDVFDTKKNSIVTQRSFSFEKASIMFNLASIYSHLAVSCANSLDWKNAILNFKNAAGVLEFMSNHFLHSPSNDLKVHATKGFAKVMSAQAQECFLFNYIQSANAIKHSLVARLSEGISNAYNSAYELTKKSHSKLDCEDELHLKAIYFHTFALFHHAEDYMDATKVGLAIANAKLAKESYSQSKRLIGTSSKGSLSENLLSLNESLEKEIEAKLDEWERDNDLIYHQALPEKNNIPAIKAMEGVKITSLEDQLKAANKKDLFDKIVPMEAHQGMSIYSEKQAQVTREWSEKIEIANEEIKSVFEFSRLPASIVEIQNILRDSKGSTLGEEEREKDDNYPRVLAMAHELEFAANSNNFNQLMDTVKNKKANIMKQLEEADSWFLKDEKNVLIKGLPESTELSKLKDALMDVRNGLSQASTSDKRLMDMWNEYSVEIGVLQKGTSGVQKWLDETEPAENKLAKEVSLLDIDDSSSASDEVQMKAAQHLIESVYSSKKSLELIISERNSTLNDLKTAMHKEDISSILIKYSGASESELDAVFNEQLAKYDGYISRLNALLTVQDDKILELKDSLGRLLDLDIVKKKAEEKRKERGTMKSKLARLIKAYDNYKICLKGASEASAFYVKLGDQVTTQVGRIFDIVNQRDSINSEQRASISSTLSSGFGGHTVNNYNQYPPQYSAQYSSQYQTPTQQQQQQPPPSYTNASTSYSPATTGASSNPTGAPPLPLKPTSTVSSNQPYSTPSVYNPGMYAQFGQNWKS